MNKQDAIEFLVQARRHTYASNGGGVEAVLPGSNQLEFQKGADWHYRDVFFMGNGLFSGIEAVYYIQKTVWSMSYFGDFSKMSEDEVDVMLRHSLIGL